MNHPEEFSVHVGNLPLDATERQLQLLFGIVAKVRDVFIPPTQNRHKSIYAFVRFRCQE